MITIRKPLCFSEIGRKDNQEDYLYPQQTGTDTRVFILCDGMGGHDNGEVASRTAAEALGDYLSGCSKVDAPTFEAGLAQAYEALDAIDTNSSKKPGTTMTCLCLNDDDYLVAHIGDSRIYHIRPSLFDRQTKRGGILYQSSDHSLVNDLLKAGELTEEEARDFPQKNIITRAMQPHLAQRHKADVYTFNDIRSGDYFFLCCDGILEQLSNEALCEILADKRLNDEGKLAAIKAICDGNTRDNYTCWLIPVDKVKNARSKSSSDIIQAVAEAGNAGAQAGFMDKIRALGIRKIAYALIIAILLVAGGIIAGKIFSKEKPTVRIENIEKQKSKSEKNRKTTTGKERASKRTESGLKKQ